jgi:hypothetical protein
MSDLLQAVNAMRPVFIFAPTARNGITLLQRLFNSSGQIMVFGENVDLVERWPLLVHAAVQTHQQLGPAMAASRQRFAHTSEYWSSDLWPDTTQYVGIVLESFCRVVLLYDQTARDAGRPRWGLKNPMLRPATVDHLIPLLPGARFIFLYRNLMDVLRSAKARQFVRTVHDVAVMAQRWREHTAVMLEPRPQVMVVRHEDLVSRPEEVVAAMEQFTGVQGMDRTVLQRRINTFQGPAQEGHSPSGYVTPQSLNDDEHRAALEQAGQLMSKLGYSPT